MNLIKLKRFIAPVVLCILIYVAVDNWEWWLDLRKISLNGFILLSLVVISLWFVGGFINRALYLPLGLQLKLLESTALAISNNLMNHLPFIQGGPLFKSVYLKRRYGFQYTRFITSLGYMHLVQLFIYSLGGLLGLGVIFLLDGISDWKITCLIAGIMIISFMLYLLTALPVGRRLTKVLHLENLAETAFTLSQNKKNIIILLVAYSVAMVLQAAQLYVAYISLGYNTSFFYCLIVIPFTMIVSLTGITPGGLGLTEAVIAFLSNALGFGFQEGAVSALLMRVVSMFWLMPFGGFSLYLLSNNKNKPALEDIK